MRIKSIPKRQFLYEMNQLSEMKPNQFKERVRLALKVLKIIQVGLKKERKKQNYFLITNPSQKY
jgi:hypothetical protein